ncbi:MAG: hypothetical protein Ct9H300mP27_02210 [Chloroflexota bacterium]|nr:MAG: hypothetical protein Ct9H300mP27_02210 [Chloroflexota bacterium]
MAKQVPGKRYAQAIFELAGQQDLIEQCESDLASISQVLQDEDFRSFLGHAKVPMSDKIRSIEMYFLTLIVGEEFNSSSYIEIIN